MKLKISQKDNYEGNFGYVYRSSAIFYYRQSEFFKTTISLMDYWSFKRQINVMLIFSLRDMDGNLINREKVSFENSKVINYHKYSGTSYEGSIEVEVFASENMVIPYAAIMAVYESENSISMCHSYARTYSPHEIEEKRTVTIGRESCWTVRDNKETKSFCIFHNGHGIQPQQIIKLEVTNHENKKLKFSHTLKSLPPYSSVKLAPQDIIGSELNEFLDGKPGNMSINYNLNACFTRMLVGNETESEFQVTHSNFNLKEHETDSAGEGKAYMHIPSVGFKNHEIIIYPDSPSGSYTVKKNGLKLLDFSNSERVSIPASDGYISISESKGIIPSRVVTGLTAMPATHNKAKLPYECNLGTIHKLRPKKSTFWGLISVEKNLESRIFIVPNESIYDKNLDESLTIKLYFENTETPIIRKLNREELNSAISGLYFSDLFPELKQNSNGRFAWFYFRTESYGGFITYSTIESESGCLTFEHSF